MKYYQKALDKGVEEAYFPLGYMYFNGYGVEKDVDKALELFESSVKCKDKDGLYFLGFLYATGFKVKKRRETGKTAVSRIGGARKRGGERIPCVFGRINEKRPCGRFFMR